MTEKQEGVPVRWVVVTAECMRRIVALTRPGHEFNQQGVAMPDGRFRIPLRESTLDRLVLAAHPGETLGDTILRVVSTSKGSN